MLLSCPLLLGLASSNPVSAQSSVPGCDPCPGPWGASITSRFTFTLPGHPGCTYVAYVTYHTRPCLGKLQYEITSHVFEDPNPAGSGCDLHCVVDGRDLDKLLNAHVINLVAAAGTPVIKITPSPCYYLGTIVVPPGAEVCFGMTPGSTRYVLMPCDNFGCCYSELTAMYVGPPVVGPPPAPNTYYQNVIMSTPCPPTPMVPPSTTIEWSCDILGGGVATFTVSFTPEMPIVCQDMCYSGLAKRGTTGVRKEPLLGVGDIAAYQVFPNPFKDHFEVSFEAAKANLDLSVEVFDISGKLVLSQRGKTIAGKQLIAIDAHELAAGTYLCRFTCGTEKIVTKLSK